MALAAAIVAALALITVPAGDAAGAGPLCLIPGQATVPVTAYARVSSVHPRRNYGHAGRWKIDYAPTNARSLIMFGLPKLPMGCGVTDAVLELRGSYSGTPGKPDRYPGASVNLSLVKRHWSESRVTWRNMPPANGCDGGSQDFARTRSWNVTGMVQEAYRCLGNGGLAAWNGLKAKGWSVPGRGASWRLVVDSRESAHPPVVKISWG